MNNQYLTMAIAKLLQDLDEQEAMAVLDAAMLLNFDKSSLQGLNQSANTYRRGRQNKISQDPEVEAFIFSLPYMKQTEILARVEAKFGSVRTPSRAGLSRYFMKRRQAV